MRILVLGGAGYIGSVTTAALIEAGHEVAVLDNLSTGHRAAVPSQARFAQADLADRVALDAFFSEWKPEGVIHFAASSLVGESMVDPGKYFRNNVANTLNLLETMAAHQCTRLVFSSTAATYGNPESVPIRELTATKPTNPYGDSKLMIEQMLGWFGMAHGLRATVLRYFNAAGAWGSLGEDHVPETHLIPLTLQVALGQRENIFVFGSDYPTHDGSAIRDYIHVYDLAQAHILALDALRDGRGGTYNLGNGNGFSVREVIEVCRDVTGHAIPSVDSPRRPGDPPVLIASSERAQRELGWKPRFPDLRSIVTHAWEWHLANPHGYQGSSSGTEGLERAVNLSASAPGSVKPSVVRVVA